jgi:hypothetical protein
MWPLADSSVEVSHNAYQEAEGVVMEAILRKGTIVSLSTSSDQAISHFLIYTYFCLLSGNLEEDSHHRNPAESELRNQVFLLL